MPHWLDVMAINTDRHAHVDFTMAIQSDISFLSLCPSQNPNLQADMGPRPSIVQLFTHCVHDPGSLKHDLLKDQPYAPAQMARDLASGQPESM